MPSEPQFSEIVSLAPEFREFQHLKIPQECRQVLAKARADHTNRTYSVKWKRFSTWCKSAKVNPLHSPPEEVLPYLLLLARSGLAHASIKVNLAAISSFRTLAKAPSLWSCRPVKQFHKGLFRMLSPVRAPPPAWQLNTVLSQLMKHLFEPIHKTDMKFLSWKVALLLVLKSARRVGEFQAFTTQEPFLQFKQDKVILRTNPKFIPKVPSDFHLNEPIILNSFFPNPQTAAEPALHSLDVKRCLRFYLNRTKSFCKSNQVLIAYSTHRKGFPITKQSISRWISSAIIFCHQQAGHRLASRVCAHSTRAISTSTVLFAGVSLPDICSAATWRTPHTFTRHYCLDAGNKRDVAVGQAVLRHLFQ